MTHESIVEAIKQFVEGTEVSKHILLDGLDAKERGQIYATIETTYANQIHCEKQSTFRGKHRQVVLVLSKIQNTEEMELPSIPVDETLIDHFRKYTRLSLPLTNVKYIDYVLDVLEPYFNCQRMFTQFLQDIEAHGNLHQFNIRINHLLDDILRHIAEHPSTQLHKTNTYDMETEFLKSNTYKTQRSCYTKENHGKLFLSIDINKADYTTLKHYHPEIFRNLSTWEEFVRSFCEDKPMQTLINSKYLREKLFGDAGVTKRTKVLSEYFIRHMLHEMNISSTDIVMLHGDEVILSYNSSLFQSISDRYHGSFFKVLAFRLVKLPKYDYFVKEYFDPSEPSGITRREFKCTPLPFLMQCIKQYEQKPMTEIDRKFMTESGHLATFDEAIF